MWSHYHSISTGLAIYFFYGIWNSVEGKHDSLSNKDELKLVMPPPPDKMYDMKQVQPENKKQAVDDDFNEDEPRYVEY